MPEPSERLMLLDLDGPLLDVSPRYHRLHETLVTRSGRTPLARDDYWRLKRNGLAEEAILQRTGLPADTCRALARERIELIETQPYLDLDEPWPWARPALKQLSELAPVVLVTQRAHRDLLERQLAAHGLTPFLARVINGRGDGTPAAKAGLCLEAGLRPGPGSAMIGDTEVDIRSGQRLGVWTIALRSGIRADHLLEACGPHVLLDDLRPALTWLAEPNGNP